MPLSRIFSIKTLVIFFATIICFSACQPEIDGDVPPPTTNPPGNTTAFPKTTTEILIDEGDTLYNLSANLSFNSNGKIGSLTYTSIPGSKIVYTYSSGKFTVDLYDAGAITLKATYLLNSAGQVDSSLQYEVGETDTTTEKYVYASGKLTRIKQYQNSGSGYVQTDETVLQYDGSGNVVKETSQSNGTLTYTHYPDLKNPLNFYPDEQAETNLIKTVSDGASTFTYTYTFDSQGRLTEKRGVDPVNDYIYIVKYTY